MDVDPALTMARIGGAHLARAFRFPLDQPADARKVGRVWIVTPRYPPLPPDSDVLRESPAVAVDEGGNLVGGEWTGERTLVARLPSLVLDARLRTKDGRWADVTSLLGGGLPPVRRGPARAGRRVLRIYTADGATWDVAATGAALRDGRPAPAFDLSGLRGFLPSAG